MSQPFDPRFNAPPPNAPNFTSGQGGAFRQDVAPAYAAFAQPQPARQPTAHGYGDAAGEYLQMPHGRYGAWIYVVFGFIGQLGFLFAIGTLVFANLAALLPIDPNLAMMIGAGLAGIFSIAGSYFTFRDRWRCIEAFSSRYCSGLMNLSLLYVPIISWGYANYRAVLKFRGR